MVIKGAFFHFSYVYFHVSKSMQAIDKLPIIPGVLELIGIGYTGVWSLTYSTVIIRFFFLEGIVPQQK